MGATLKASKRENFSKSYTKELRSEGDIPAIVYGYSQKPQAVQVSSIDLLKTLRDEGRNAIISLTIENGQKVDVMLQDYQADPIKNEVLHADFYAVNLDEERDVEVAIHLNGEAQGVKDGGILQQPLHHLNIRAKPNDIPEQITVDIDQLEVGDSIMVGDLKGSKNYEIVDADDNTIVTILPPQVEEVVESGEQQEEQPEDSEETPEDEKGEEESSS
ncbi:50S ribosomal protein L25/general stress protein Ctc [Bacillaceae bacterium S4-13-58]